MHFLTSSLLLLATSFTSIAIDVQEKSCDETKSAHADHDHSVLLQNDLLVHRHVNEQIPDKDKKVNEEPVGAKLALSEQRQEVNRSDKKVAVHDIPDWLKGFANAVQDLIPNTNHLGKTYDDVIHGASMFTADERACVSAMKKVDTKDDAALAKAVEEAFACFDTAVGKLARVVKIACKHTIEFLKTYLPKEAGITLEDEQRAVMASAEDLAAIATAVKQDVIGVNASMICAKVTKGFESLEVKAVAFIQSMTNLNPLQAKDQFEELRAQIESVEKKLPRETKERANELFNKLSAASDAILEEFPAAEVDFKNNVVMALTGHACEGLQAGAPKLTLQGFLGLPALLSVSMLVIGLIIVGCICRFWF